MREPGYYWVRKPDSWIDWEIEYWDGKSWVTEPDIAVINETRILNPDESINRQQSIESANN